MTKEVSGNFRLKINKINVIFLGIFVLVFGLGFALGAPILDQLHLNIQTTDGSGNIVTGTFDFVFNISTDNSCTTVVYSNSTSLTTDSRGIISYYLTDTNLDYDEQYYLCYYRDGSLIETSKIARTPYSFTAQNMTLSGIIVDSNLALGGYNISASYLFGDGRYLTNLNVSALNLSDYVPYTGSDKNVVLGDYNFSVGTSDLFVDSSTGRVGIGTTRPNAKLHVNGSAIINGTLIGLSNATDLTGAVTLAQLQGVNTTLGNYIPYTGSNANVVLGAYNLTVDGTTFFVNSNTDRVGIGTTSPNYKLDVVGNVNAYNLLINGTAITAGANLSGSGTANYLSKWTGSGTLASSGVYENGSNIGIGTTVPGAKLDVDGNVSMTGRVMFSQGGNMYNNGTEIIIEY